MSIISYLKKRKGRSLLVFTARHFKRERKYMLHGYFYNWMWGFSKLDVVKLWETSHSWLTGYLHKSLEFHLQLPNWAQLLQTSPRIETALTEQELLLPAKGELGREVSHCSSFSKQEFHPPSVLRPSGESELPCLRKVTRSLKVM